MQMSVAESKGGIPPDWDALFEVAQGQQGYFTTRQAASVGYSPQLLHKYLQNRTVVRVRRGIYRLVHFPASQEEDLVPLWLWSDRVGVFSHETAPCSRGSFCSGRAIRLPKPPCGRVS